MYSGSSWCISVPTLDFKLFIVLLCDDPRRTQDQDQSPIGLGSEFVLDSSITKRSVVLHTTLLLCRLRVGATRRLGTSHRKNFVSIILSLRRKKK